MEDKDYVSPELAKELIEKGIPIPFSYLMVSQSISLYYAQKWLRERHQLSVEVFYDCDGLWNVYVCKIEQIVTDYLIEKFAFDSYEEALNEGIKEALKLI